MARAVARARIQPQPWLVAGTAAGKEMVGGMAAGKAIVAVAGMAAEMEAMVTRATGQRA